MDEYTTLIDTIKMLAEAVERHENILSKHETVIKNYEMHIQRLYNNRNVILGWQPAFNKQKIDYLMEFDIPSGVTSSKREKKIIVSLTSYPARMYDIKYTLFSLLNQSLKPDMIILWLGKEKFPNGIKDVSPTIQKLQEKGISIEFCEDIRSYTKLIPCLKKYPNDIIVTADDDIYYPENWLEQLYESYIRNPQYIFCHRAHRVGINREHQIDEYNKWDKCIGDVEPRYTNFLTGVGGVLYPPNSLHCDVFDKEKFKTLCPSADDIWFWAMAVLKGTKIEIVKNGIKNTKSVNIARDLGLVEGEGALSINNTMIRSENDTQLNALIQEYPQIMDVLLQEVNM